MTQTTTDGPFSGPLQLKSTVCYASALQYFLYKISIHRAYKQFYVPCELKNLIVLVL